MGTPHLDDLDVQGKRSLVVVSTILLLIISIFSSLLRIYAKLYPVDNTVGKLQSEDWFMGIALLFSLGTPTFELYVGVFVIITSIIRLVALFAIDTKDLTFSQVEGGVWTYMEQAIGITCGNLVLLQPLFHRFFSNKDSHNTNQGSSPHSYGLTSPKNILPQSCITSKSGRTSKLYTRISEDTAPSDHTRQSSIAETEAEAKDIEMQDPDCLGRDSKEDKGREGNVILVKTDVTAEKERSTDHERYKLARDSIDTLRGAGKSYL
ncbi:hypothetical protein NHQ30_009231 [Ciborinia camelliae]|nr:hypothetical protein NHQ30_009231 [Ciborinia camelliae]